MTSYNLRSPFGAQMQRALRAFRRALHVHRDWFREILQCGHADAQFDAGEFGGGQPADQQALRRSNQICEAVAHRFGVTPHALDQARATSEWLEHEHMLTAIRKREYETSRHPAELAGNVLRNMGQAFEEADPIAAAINREFTSFAAELVDEEDDDAECCATCGTELAFAGDVCGICNPGVLPQLQ